MVDLSEARLVPVEQVHLTLHFIGDTDVREMARVRESVERSASGLGPFTLTATGLIQLPERGRPRLIAAETDAPAALLELQRRLAHRLARAARRNAGDRFRPHLTLCRSRRGGRGVRLAGGGVALSAGLSWTVERVRLMSSVLGPGGAAHRVEDDLAL